MKSLITNLKLIYTKLVVGEGRGRLPYMKQVFTIKLTVIKEKLKLFLRRF